MVSVMPNHAGRTQASAPQTVPLAGRTAWWGICCAAFLVAVLEGAFFCRDLYGAAPPDGLTLTQFRAEAAGRNARAGQTPAAPQATTPQDDEAFFRLMRAQAREAAARQSLDRLEGWLEATRKRVEAENVPPLDAEMLGFAVGRIAAELARYEQSRAEALRQANQVLGRPPDSPLTPLPHDFQDLEDAGPPATTKPSPTGDISMPSDPAAVRPENSAPSGTPGELLSLGTELLAKIYQGYLFGGLPVSTLLWQEREVFETDLQQRLRLIQSERRRFSLGNNR